MEKGNYKYYAKYSHSHLKYYPNCMLQIFMPKNTSSRVKNNMCNTYIYIYVTNIKKLFSIN